MQLVQWNRRVDSAHQRAQRWDERLGLGGSTNDDVVVPRRALCEMLIDLQVAGFVEPLVFDIWHDADDGDPAARRRVTTVHEPLADGFFARPDVVREQFVDDRHTRRAIVVRGAEQSASTKGRPHRGEIAGRHITNIRNPNGDVWIRGLLAFSDDVVLWISWRQRYA